MVDWPPVIDADGHVLERQSDIRKYLEPPWNRRETALWPANQPFDSDLFETLGYRDYPRGMSLASNSPQDLTARRQQWRFDSL